MLGVLLISFVLLIITSSVVFDRLFGEYERRLTARRNETIVRTITNLYDRDGNLKGVSGQIPYFCMMLGACVKVLDSDGKMVVDYCVNTDSSSSFGRLKDSDSTRIPLALDGKPIGTLFINTMLHQPITGAPEGLLRTSIGWSIVATGFVSALVALSVGFLFSRRILGPVATLTAAAEKIEGGDLAQRVEVGAPDEIGRLSTAFNRMSEAVRLNEELRRRLVEDVAHELRTPLAAMQCAVEGMQDGVVPVDEESLRSLHMDLSRLSRAVSDIGALSWAESRKLSMKRERTSIPGIIRGVAQRLLAAYGEKRIRLAFQEAGEGEALVDPAMTETALFNIMENAFKYSKPEGEVRVAIRGGGDRTIIAVADDGQGVDKDDLPHIFERFYRSRKAGKEEGTGVGLAVARELVAAQGGTIEVESTPGKGSTFTIVFREAGGRPLH
jgi:signal transduction histidine kinase